MKLSYTCSSGTLWIGLNSYRLILRTPRSTPYFSERNGYVPTLKLGFGYRLQWKKI